MPVRSVIISKKDEAARICIDYRKQNGITVSGAEPISSADELITLMSTLSFFFSKLDMTQ